MSGFPEREKRSNTHLMIGHYRPIIGHCNLFSSSSMEK